MLNKYEFVGKNKEEAINKIKTELTENINDLYIEETVINGKLFKSGKVILTVITKEDVKKYIEEFILNYSKLMNIEINFEIVETDGVYNITLVSTNNPILIGREGKTLEAFQLLLRQAVKNQTNNNIKINVDISGYKSKKLKRLEYEVKKIAYEVQNSKIDASLDPMNSYERRKIHTLISTMNNLKTESIGEGAERHIVIKYVEKTQ